MKRKIKINQPVMIKLTSLQANNYNPNSMPSFKLDMLKRSILDYGFCFPIVVYKNKTDDTYTIIDGYHRFIAMQQLKAQEISAIVLNLTENQIKTATLVFNKAKGLHSLELEAKVLQQLHDSGMSVSEICEALKISPESMYRYTNELGINSLADKHEYTQ